jgi:hypothetical protein
MRGVMLLLIGLAIGIVSTMFYLGSPRQINAASNDRYGDFIMATGAVSINPRIQTDGVWMLDYRQGKLLGSVIDKTQGKIVGWAEVDLTSEFGFKAQQDVHFMMTTGYVTQGQSALYVAETTSGKFGVYTMGPGTNGVGIVIRRHDMTSFRSQEQAVNTPQPNNNNQPNNPQLNNNLQGNKDNNNPAAKPLENNPPKMPQGLGTPPTPGSVPLPAPNNPVAPNNTTPPGTIIPPPAGAGGFPK